MTLLLMMLVLQWQVLVVLVFVVLVLVAYTLHKHRKWFLCNDVVAVAQVLYSELAPVAVQIAAVASTFGTTAAASYCMPTQ